MITYSLRKAEQREPFPEIDLLPQISHRGKQLDIAIFGDDIYKENIQNMKKRYFHSKVLSNVTFTPAKTGESISAVSYPYPYDPKRPSIYDTEKCRLQLGWVGVSPEGVWVNPPLDAEGNLPDEGSLKLLLRADKKVNGIYLLDNGLAFAPHDSFTYIGNEPQDNETFSRSGLARALEYTEKEVAENIRMFTRPGKFKRGVEIAGFKEAKQFILKVVHMSTIDYDPDYSDCGYTSFFFANYNHESKISSGYAVGVLDQSVEDASLEK